MEKRKITKKVISKTPAAPSLEQVAVKEEKEVESSGYVKSKRSCYFCQSKTNPSYTDLVNLKRFLTDRAKILPKLRSSVCSRHQRAVGKQIKYARHLSLLPFVPKV